MSMGLAGYIKIFAEINRILEEDPDGKVALTFQEICDAITLVCKENGWPTEITLSKEDDE